VDRQVPEALRAARRSLETLYAVRLLRDWSWIDDLAKWVLHSEISIQTSDKDLVPEKTEWFIFASSDYPYGYLEFFPSKVNSLTKTFPHQTFNSEGRSELPWREGNICLSSSSGIFKRQFSDIEPFEIDWRLHWRFERAIEWLHAASENQLRLPGEPFELPDFPKQFQKTFSSIVFNESATSFSQWKESPTSVGLVDLHPLQEGSKTIFAKVFKNTRGQEIFQPTWGRFLTETNGSGISGLWILLKNTPVIDPWQAPSNWKELREVFQRQERDLNETLKSSLRLIRRESVHILLVGFPIPSQVGHSSSRIHWQGLEIPLLSNGKEPINGFRCNEIGYWHRDRTELLRDSRELSWMNSENWGSEQIMTRGRFCQEIISKKVLLIGAGALGSVTGEMLVRGGLQGLLVIDLDELEIGNICRHTLTIKELQKSKSVELAHRLNCISPHAKVEGLNCTFSSLSEVEYKCIQECDLILDCTGSDEVIQQLGQFRWESKKYFFSMSLGMEAKRLFIFTARGMCFPSESFRISLNPWLAKEMEEYRDKPLPWSGIGCWHPVFPARVDDVWMLAAVGVKCVDKLMRSPSKSEKMIVFEQDIDMESDCFQGIRRAQL
jgi:hypothetical protein